METRLKYNLLMWVEKMIDIILPCMKTYRNYHVQNKRIILVGKLTAVKAPQKSYFEML